MQAVAGTLPQGPRDAVGGTLGAAAGDLFRVRRGLVEQNLRRAFPDESGEWRDAIALESYRHLGREALTIMALRSSSPEEVRERTRVIGW